MLQCAISNGRGPDHQGAIGNGGGNGLEFLRLLEDGRSTHGRFGLPKTETVRIHNSQMTRPEIAHGASSCPNVEGIARTHQHHNQIVEVGQGLNFTPEKGSYLAALERPWRPSLRVQ